ncbi:MAG: site-specific DNA-methyltransferase, partial [Acetobacteraceae bacterium]|nr:site-specific DNA-methyltransferase [Acetobacteraceae bacterium]
MYRPGKGGWKTNVAGLVRLSRAGRIETYGTTASFRRYTSDFPYFPISNTWIDTASGGYGTDKIYVVQTNQKIVERCILMTTDPGDLVLDPTCGSGTTAYVAEQWGRRWITIDTSRVSLALARARIIGARYPYYLLADSPEGQRKEGEITRTPPKQTPTRGDIRQGLVYERVPHITLKSIANNAEIDVIWEKYQPILDELRAKLNAAMGFGKAVDARIRERDDTANLAGTRAAPVMVGEGRPSATSAAANQHDGWQEWEIPREADPAWSTEAKALHQEWWQLRIRRQQEVDASIASKAEPEYLYDRPYPDPGRVRVAGPFTVESLSPHRILPADQDDELAESAPERRAAPEPEEVSFAQIVLDNLRMAGVQQAHKEDRITFTALTGWPGEYICAEGRYMESEKERRAGIFIGPEFGTVARPDLVAAAREAADAGFDVLIACAFNFDAHSAEFDKLGRIPVLKARMNTDLHMADQLKNTGAGNLFVMFGEPDIEIAQAGEGQIQVRVRGVDIFRPQEG